MGVNMEAVAKINAELYYIRKELEPFDAVKQFAKPFSIRLPPRCLPKWTL